MCLKAFKDQRDSIHLRIKIGGFGFGSRGKFYEKKNKRTVRRVQV